MRVAASKRDKSPETLAKLSAAQSISIKVEVTDLETNSSIIYHAIKAAARALGIDRRYIEHYIYLNQNEPVFGKYIFKFVNLNGDSTNLVSVVNVQKTSKKVKVTNVDTK